MALGVMTGLWSLRPRSLHADFCAGERVMGIKQNISGLGRDDRVLVIAPKVLMCRFLGWRTRYEREPVPQRIRQTNNLYQQTLDLLLCVHLLVKINNIIRKPANRHGTD